MLQLASDRVFTVSDNVANVAFRDNFVRTFKYTLVTFVPKNLFGK